MRLGSRKIVQSSPEKEVTEVQEIKKQYKNSIADNNKMETTKK